jgi:hypothetical protein
MEEDMKTRHVLAQAGLAALALAAQPAGAFDIELSNGWKATIRGFVAARGDYDESNMGGSEPLFPPRDGTPEADESTLRFSANQTQLGFGIRAPDYGGLINQGYLEFDFLNEQIPPDDRPVTASPRLRHAWWSLGWNGGNSSLLVGQTNVLFGDLLPDLTYDNLNLSLGSLFGREPQVRYTHVMPLATGSDFTFAGSVNAPNSGFFNEATDTAETTAVPYLHAKIAYHNDRWGKADYFGFENGPARPLELALSGFIGREKIDQVAIAGTEEVQAWGLAASALVPIIGIRDDRRAGSLSVMGQLWIGSNMDSYFGGNGQGIYETAAGDVDGIEGRGFFLGAKYFVTDRLWLNAIYGYEENDLDDLVNAGTPFRIASGLFSGATFGTPGVGDARNVNVTLWYSPLQNLYTGLGWDYRKASYNDGVDGTNNRVSLSLFYNF